MAFFDIGINITVNGGPAAVATFTQLQNAMRGVVPSAQQASAGIQQVDASLKTNSATVQNNVSIYNSFGQIVKNMGAQFSATTGPIETLRAGMNQLGITTSNTLQAVQSTGGPLNNLNASLGQTAGSMDKATTSGSRLAELFRGNRGLVFGASALFGTLTGIAFEFQLVSDAQGQVSESTARLNQLTAEGKQNTAEFSQAQQALAKDMRFLEFSSRNLALAFTNLIPDVLLIINGMLNLQSKLVANRVAQQELATTTRLTGVEIRTTGIMAATSLAPLAGLGVAGRSAAVGMEAAGVGARFLGISLRSLLITTGIGAALVVLGLALEPLIEKFIQTRDASAEAAAGLETSGSQIATSGAAIEKNFAGLEEASTAMKEGVLTSADDMASGFSQSAQQMIDKANETALRLKVLPQEVLLSEMQSKQASLGAHLQDKLKEVNSPIGLQPFSEAFGDLMKGKLPEIITPIGKGTAAQQADIKKTIADMRANSADIKAIYGEIDNIYNTAQAKFGNQGPEALRLAAVGIAAQESQARVQAGVSKVLADQRASLLASGGKTEDIEAAGHRALTSMFKGGDLQTALKEYDNYIQQYKDHLKETEKDEQGLTKAERDKQKAYDEGQKIMNEYNQVIDKLPLVLQDTGVATKALSDQELLRQNIIRSGAEVFIGYANAQSVSLGVAAQVAEQGNKITAGLIEQRDAVAANNLIWDNMNTILYGTNQTVAEWITNQQEMIFNSIDVTKAFTNQTYQTYLLNQGLIEGRQAAKDFIDGAIQSGAASRQFGEDMMAAMDQIRVSGDLTLGQILPEGIKLTNEEMKSLVTSFAETGHVGAALADIVDSRMAPAFETLRGVIDAANKKEFNEAFKKLDFGDLNKNALKDFKNLDDTMNKIQKQGTQMVNIISELRTGVSMGDLKNSTLRQGLDEISESLANVIKLNPQLSALNPLVTFLDGLGKKDRAFVISTLGESLQTLFAKIQSGKATNYDVIAFWDKVNEIFGTTDQSAQGLKASLDDLKRSQDSFKTFQKKGTGIDTGMDIEDVVRGSGQPLIGKGGPAVPVKPPEDQKDTTERQKLLTDLNKTIPVAAQAAQTALANLATQGVRSLTMLAQGSSTAITGLRNNLNVGYVAAGHIQVGLANLANQGLRSLALLAAASSTAINGLRNNLNIGYVAAGHLQIGLANLDNQGSASLLQLADNSSTAANGMRNNLNVAYVAAGHLQVGLANLDNQGSKSIKELESNISSALSKVDSKMSSTESKVKSLARAFIALAAAAKKAQKAMGGGGGGGSDSPEAQHGMHTTLKEDTLILAHRGEEVNIDTVGATQSNKQMRARGGGDTTINLQVTTVNELDGDVIGTTVTRKTFRKISTR